MRTLGDVRITVDDRASAQIAEVMARMEAIELRQLARDRREERPFVDLEVIDLGGESG